MPEEDKIKKPITDEIATASKDIDYLSGYTLRLENPDPTLRTESRGKGLKLYDEVDRDPHAGSVLQTRYLAVVGKEWDVIPAESARKPGRPAAATQEQKIAGFVKDTLKATNFEQAMQEMLQAILYGFYPAEVIWKNTDQGIKISKIRSKHPRRFSFTQARELRLLTLQNMIDGEAVPPRKFIVFSYGSSDNPFGKGLGQKLWWPVWFKKHGIKFWLVFLEKFGMPTAVGKYPPGTDKPQQQALLDAIDAIHNETGIKVPDTMAIELLEATRQGKVTYETLCDYMDRQISKAVLGQTLTTEVGDRGSYAASQTHDAVRQDIIGADATLLCETLNETLIPWIVDFNFPGIAEYPQFTIRVEEEKDLKPLAERDQILAEIGLPIGKKYFYDTYGIPEPEAGEEIIEEQSARRTAQGLGEFAEGKFSKEQGAIEGLVNASVARARAKKAMQGLTAPVREVVEGAASLEEVRDKIYASYSDMEPQKIDTLLAQALFVADLHGRAAAAERMKREARKAQRA